MKLGRSLEPEKNNTDKKETPDKNEKPDKNETPDKNHKLNKILNNTPDKSEENTPQVDDEETPAKHQKATNGKKARNNQSQVRNNRNKKRKRKTKKLDKLTLMYTNLNGIQGKVKSLENTANSVEAHIVAVTETKQKPPKLQGYGKWISKERKDKGGGGVAICARQDIANKLTKIEDLDEQEQEIIWTELKNTKKEITQLAVYYGKQEKENRNTIQAEFQNLATQVNQTKSKGEIIMSGDFNAKLENNTENHKQKLSPNGHIMNEQLIKETQMKPISLKSSPGKWTWEHRTNTNQKSIIDYILVTPKLEDKIINITVDEEGLHRIEGKKPTDHNTIILQTQIEIQKEKKTVQKWNLNNKEGWKNYNTVLQEKYKSNKPVNQTQMNKLITDTLKETIGQTRVTINGKAARKPTEQEKNKRINKKEAAKIYKKALKTDRKNLEAKLQMYKNAQKELIDQIEIDLQNRAKQKLDKYKKEGHMKQNQIWKLKEEAEAATDNDQYDTITEDGKILQGPNETKEYIANFFEDLYQARPAKDEYKEDTSRIEQEVKEYTEKLKNEPAIPDFTLDDLNNVIKKLERKKATGPDNIPNEIFIEADEQTKLIYLENYNKINKTMDIPNEWQEGEIIRIYKGKGMKGKCSNERGITKSSNYGKVYERLINERILPKLNITDAQAGGKKGSATVDHILLLKEIFKAAKRAGLNIDITLLDVTKAYDKAWLTGILHVLYNQGLSDNHWTIVKKLNENLTAKIMTKFGPTRMIKIKDSIRQGGVLSTTLYGILMDEISKALSKEKHGIELIKNQLRIGSLLWVDDVAVVEEEGKLQPPLNTTDKVSNKYHIEFGKPKSNSMTIKNNKKKPINKEYQIGQMTLDKKQKYKYLGYLQNEKNNNDDQFTAIQGRTESAYQKMMALTGNTNFLDLEMETIWLVTKACITPAITYSGEAWEPTKQNYNEANKILDNILKRILKTPKGTPREPLYIETGLIDPETIITNNRINMEARIIRNDNQTMKQILHINEKDSWAQQNNNIKQQLGIENHELKQDKSTTKMAIKKAALDAFKNKLLEDCKDKTKVQYFLEGKDEWKIGHPAEYMKNLNRNQASTIFKARTRMLPVKGNQKNEYTDKNGQTHLTCRLCKREDETQQHILEKCTARPNSEMIITKQEIFNEDVEQLKEIAKHINKILEALQETNNSKPDKTTSNDPQTDYQ